MILTPQLTDAEWTDQSGVVTGALTIEKDNPIGGSYVYNGTILDEDYRYILTIQGTNTLDIGAQVYYGTTFVDIDSGSFEHTISFKASEGDELGFYLIGTGALTLTTFTLEVYMAFGLAVSDYNIQTGTYGKIIKVDLSEKMAYAVRWVQGESDSNVKSDVISSESELSTLYAYMEDSSCPDLAWSFNGITLTIFFKNDTYDTRFAFEFLRNPHKVTADSSLIDVKEEDIELVKAYALESFYKSKQIRVPYPIQKTIQEEEERIENED